MRLSGSGVDGSGVTPTKNESPSSSPALLRKSASGSFKDRGGRSSGFEDLGGPVAEEDGEVVDPMHDPHLFAKYFSILFGPLLLLGFCTVGTVAVKGCVDRARKLGSLHTVAYCYIPLNTVTERARRLGTRP